MSWSDSFKVVVVEFARIFRGTPGAIQLSEGELDLVHWRVEVPTWHECRGDPRGNTDTVM